MDLFATLGSICGEDAVRPAAADDQIGGAKPSLVVSPASVEQVSDVLRAIDAAGATTCVIGAGTAVHVGVRPAALDVLLSTARLDRVLEHSPGDLQIRTQAGVRLSAVQRRLSGDRQRLALDPPHDGTLGGIVATNAAGPLRHRYGGARDLLLGVTLALPDGTVAKAGGKVVKNVAGYDLCKLVTGSYGTLAVVLETTFRLHHVPASTTVLRHPVTSGADVAAVLDTYARTKVEPSALEVDVDLTTGGHVDALLEGTAAGVAARAETIRAALPSVGSEARSTPAPTTATLNVGVSLRPAGVPTFIDGVRAALGGATGRITGRAGVGVLSVALAGSGTLEPAIALASIRSLAAAHDGAAVVHSAPDGLELDVWGPVRGLDLMRRVKEQFDPRRRLAPGRFVGGI